LVQSCSYPNFFSFLPAIVLEVNEKASLFCQVAEHKAIGCEPISRKPRPSDRPISCWRLVGWFSPGAILISSLSFPAVSIPRGKQKRLVRAMRERPAPKNQSCPDISMSNDSQKRLFACYRLRCVRKKSLSENLRL